MIEKKHGENKHDRTMKAVDHKRERVRFSIATNQVRLGSMSHSSALVSITLVDFLTTFY